MKLRWNPCIEHRPGDALDFLRTYFASTTRRAVLICGGGFDARAAFVPRLLAETMGNRLSVLALREERPDPDADLLRSAEANLDAIYAACEVAPEIRAVQVFENGFVVLGRRVIDVLNKQAWEGVTDVIVDLSALSIGASFPAIRFLDAKVCSSGVNLHALLIPAAGGGVVSRELTDSMTTVHGFYGGLGTEEANDMPKLWIPQLGPGRRTALEIIHSELGPDSIVPVLPFPCAPPRAGDELLIEFINEIEDSWAVDPRDILYADERHPLDFYRSIARIHDGWQSIFGDLRQSLLVLTPVGRKALSLGALMAAIEFNLPVVYVETLAYQAEAARVDVNLELLTHIWLAGEVYP